jgi:hypothetical protein
LPFHCFEIPEKTGSSCLRNRCASVATFELAALAYGVPAESAPATFPPV